MHRASDCEGTIKNHGEEAVAFTVTSSKRSMSSTGIAATKYMTQNSDDSDFDVEVELNDNILETNVQGRSISKPSTISMMEYLFDKDESTW